METCEQKFPPFSPHVFVHVDISINTRSSLPSPPLEFLRLAQSAGNRGYVLQLCNAIRLQADTMPPTEFLRTYLNSHEQWRNFLGSLREATLEQQTPGLGFEVSDLARLVYETKQPFLCTSWDLFYQATIDYSRQKNLSSNVNEVQRQL